MDYDLKVANPENTNLYLTGIATFTSFVFFGIIPLIPFMFINANTSYAFELSMISTFVALILLGVLKWKVIGHGLARSVAEIVFIGGIAAVVAFSVGLLFRIAWHILGAPQT